MTSSLILQFWCFFCGRKTSVLPYSWEVVLISLHIATSNLAFANFPIIHQSISCSVPYSFGWEDCRRNSKTVKIEWGCYKWRFFSILWRYISHSLWSKLIINRNSLWLSIERQVDGLNDLEPWACKRLHSISLGAQRSAHISFADFFIIYIPSLERPATRRHLVTQPRHFSMSAEDIFFLRVTVTDCSCKLTHVQRVVEDVGLLTYVSLIILLIIHCGSKNRTPVIFSNNFNNYWGIFTILVQIINNESPVFTCVTYKFWWNRVPAYVNFIANGWYSLLWTVSTRVALSHTWDVISRKSSRIIRTTDER